MSLAPQLVTEPDQLAKISSSDSDELIHLGLPSDNRQQVISAPPNLQSLFVVRSDHYVVAEELWSRSKKDLEVIGINKDSFTEKFIELYLTTSNKLAEIMMQFHSESKLGGGQSKINHLHVMDAETMNERISNSLPKGEDYAVINLDSARLVQGEYQLEFSRVYAPGAERKLYNGAPQTRPGAKDLEDQLDHIGEKVRDKKIILVDDGTHSGGTLKQALAMLSTRNLKVVGAVVGVCTGSSEDFHNSSFVLTDQPIFDNFQLSSAEFGNSDISIPLYPTVIYQLPEDPYNSREVEQLEYRDLTIFGGNVTRIFSNLNYRTPLLLPFATPSETIGLPRGYDEAFSSAVWQNMKILYAELETFINQHKEAGKHQFSFRLDHLDPFIKNIFTEALAITGDDSKKLTEIFSSLDKDSKKENKKGQISVALDKFYKKAKQFERCGFRIGEKLFYVEVCDSKVFDDDAVFHQAKELITKIQEQGYDVGLFSSIDDDDLKSLRRRFNCQAPSIIAGGRIVNHLKNPSRLELFTGETLKNFLHYLDTEIQSIASDAPGAELQQFTQELVDPSQINESELVPNTYQISSPFSPRENGHTSQYHETSGHVGITLKFPEHIYNSVIDRLIKDFKQEPYSLKINIKENPQNKIVIISLQERESSSIPARHTVFRSLIHHLGTPEVISAKGTNFETFALAKPNGSFADIPDALKTTTEATILEDLQQPSVITSLELMLAKLSK